MAQLGKRLQNRSKINIKKEPTMAEEQKTISESEKKKEDWMNSKWRPMMGWSYMLTCIADFVIFPVLWSVLQAISKGQVNVQWQPITLQGAGLYHIAMGAVLGIAAYGRTQEKLGGANNGGLSTPVPGGTTYAPPAPIQLTTPAGFGTPSAGGFASAPSPAPASGFGGNTGFGTPTTADVVTGFGGKPAPVIPAFPER
jgi:hypothetical protein